MWEALSMSATSSASPGASRDDSNATGLVGRSPGLLRVLDSIEKVARAPRTTVLVTGETGTGKELVARAIHARSARASGPFVAVNCSVSSPELFASELFGHVPGAFTGALPRGHAGLLASAEGGTLLLDEIGELDASAQAQLLRVLQERAYRPVGSTADVRMDVRLVAATHRDLPKLVAEGRFREDLWYRLNVASIHLPPLRERRQDVPELVQHLLERIARDHGRVFAGITPAALDRLARHAWPGNVRELAHALERAAIEASGACIEPEHIQWMSSARTATSDRRFVLEVEELSLAAVERSLIERVLSESGGNRSLAARTLGMHRATLHGKLRAHSLAARAG
jgi:transcriptional regulator with PAS, ATPase and Fis domain